MADNLITSMYRLSWNLGAPSSWNPQSLSRPVMGLLYLYLYLYPYLCWCSMIHVIYICKEKSHSIADIKNKLIIFFGFKMETSPCSLLEWYCSQVRTGKRWGMVRIEMFEEFGFKLATIERTQTVELQKRNIQKQRIILTRITKQ